MRDYVRLLGYLKAHLALATVAVLSLIASALFDGISLVPIVPLADRVLNRGQITLSTSLPPFLQTIILRLNEADPMRLLGWLCLVGIALMFFKCLFLFLQDYLMSDLSQRFVRDIRNKLFERLQLLSLDYFSEKKQGTLLSRITYDAGFLQDSVAVGMLDLIYRPCQMAIFATIAFYIHWKLAILSLVLLPAIILPVVKIGKRLHTVSVEAMEDMSDLNTTVQETIGGIQVIKSFNLESRRQEKFERHNEDFYHHTMKRMKRIQAIGPFSEFIAALGALFILFIGGRDVVQGRLSSGVFIFFLGALLSLIKPAKKLTSSYGLFKQTLAVTPRILELLEERPSVVERPNAKALAPVRERIEFQEVSFGYETQPVLEEITFLVPVGEVVAIVGRSGVGKTTLVNLIPRFYDPTRGRILIDGVDLREVTLRSLRDQVGMVSQETILFNDTIYANIAYGRPQATREELLQAARMSHADSFIQRMPRSYDTPIGDRGLKLSGGERQRLALARAFLKNPPILILDEATSQLDAESERLVQSAMDQLMTGRTVFVIAHRLSTVTKADRIIVLEGGRIAAIGSHRELLERGGLYQKLYAMQFEGV